MSQEFDETPWTERQWEEFMRQSELRSARFADLFETLRDHPDRDALIDREMGWDSDSDLEEAEFDFPSADAWCAAEELESDEEDDEEDLEEIEADRPDPHDVPAYDASFAWGRRVLKLLGGLGELEADLDEIVARALESSLSAGAKVAAGHGMGEEDQSICGNIVCCKRAAAFAEQGIEALEELAQRGCFSAETMQPLIEEGRRVQQLIENRIADLRSRVWWE